MNRGSDFQNSALKRERIGGRAVVRNQQKRFLAYQSHLPKRLQLIRRGRKHHQSCPQSSNSRPSHLRSQQPVLQDAQRARKRHQSALAMTAIRAMATAPSPTLTLLPSPSFLQLMLHPSPIQIPSPTMRQWPTSLIESIGRNRQ